MSIYAECFLQYCKAVECCTFCMYCGHGIGCCVLCTGVLTAICQWCVYVCWWGGPGGVWMRLQLPELAERLCDGSAED